jgi:hypothetical protein
LTPARSGGYSSGTSGINTYGGVPMTAGRFAHLTPLLAGALALACGLGLTIADDGKSPTKADKGGKSKGTSSGEEKSTDYTLGFPKDFKPLSGRTGAVREKLLKEGGGNEASEKAVAAGLLWLALHQAPDGHWGLQDFNKYARTAPLPTGIVVRDDSTPETVNRNDVAGTALALLPFLGAGITHRKPAKPVKPDYTRTVSAGLSYLMAKQTKAGARAGSFGSEMYAHALATVVLCEAYGMTATPSLKAPAQLALNYLLRAQHTAGGWRYSPGQAGDTSVTAWVVMALKSAQMARLTVPPAALRAAVKFLGSVESKDGGEYGYLPGDRPTVSCTAMGLLCRLYLGAGPRNPGVVQGVKKVRAVGPGKSNDLIYEYYATQVLHHLGGDDWKAWNLGPDGDGKGGIRDSLIAKQDDGKKNKGNAGSWSARGDKYGANGGRLMTTALALLTLEVYYRHLPLFALEKGPAGD